MYFFNTAPLLTATESTLDQYITTYSTDIKISTVVYFLYMILPPVGRGAGKSIAMGKNQTCHGTLACMYVQSSCMNSPLMGKIAYQLGKDPYDTSGRIDKRKKKLEVSQ